MGQSNKLTLLPRQGRGLVTAYNAQSMGELHDSFLEFENLHIRDSAWVARVRDASIDFGNNGPVRSMHKFNRVSQTDGTIAAHLLVVAGTDLYDYYGFFNSSLTTVFDPYELYFETVKNRVYFAGANNTPKIFDGTDLIPWGANGASTVLTYTALNLSSAFTGVAKMTVTVNNGDATVTRTAGDTFTTGPNWEGNEIVIDGTAYTILSVTDINNCELTETYQGVNAAGITAYVHYGDLSWSLPPKYSYVYYNPTTGHVTNGCPVLQLSEQNVNGVNVYLHSVMTNSILFGYGYTKIVLFRTPRDGSDLKDLYLTAQVGVVGIDGMIINQNADVALDVIDQEPDTALGLVFGNADLPYRNNPAPMMRFVAYWKGRFWGIEEDQQWRLRFTGDTASIPLGVPEECWPEAFFRDISGPDGYATGLRVVGTSLLIMTEGNTFFISGNSEDTFEIERISTRGFGISQKGVDEHPGDTTSESSSAIYASRDKRIWRHYAGGKIEDIGAPIQNHWDQAHLGTRHPFIVKVFRLGKLWLAAVGYMAAPFQGFRTFFYDFDAQAWYDWGYNVPNKVYSVTSFPNIGTGPEFDGSTIGLIGPFLAQDGLIFLNAISEQFQALDSSLVPLTEFTPYVAHFKTQHLDHGDRIGKKVLESVWLYTNDSSMSGWAVSAYFDENANPVILTQANLNASPRYPGPNIICFTPTEPVQWRSCSYRVDIPGPGGKLFRMEAIFKPESTGTAGTPT